jgi:phosphoribosyl 1,2-cyclic phosphodiesterase
MKINILGTRGSLPSTNPETMRYGGNTSCVEVSEGDQIIILDAGTGMLQFSKEKVTSQKRFDILLTHLHIDHIQGLGFFKPLFDTEKEVHIWGPASSSHTLQQRLNRYLSPPLFPVRFRDLSSQLHLHEVSQSDFHIGNFKINSRFINHPGPTIGYRISNNHSVLSYLPDHEPFLGNRGLMNGKKWISGMSIAQNADLLIHDSQYSEEEYLMHVGWGHCSIYHAAEFASLAEVDKLLLFHHDPNHTDHQLDKIYSDFMNERSYKYDIELAAEGSVFELD